MITLKQSDLDELRKSYNFLSDVIMEFYFTYLSSIYPSDSILFVPPTVSFLAANSVDAKDVRDCLKPLDLPAKGLILFPVNNGGTHWSLLVYHRKLNIFVHHDSMRGLNNSHALELYYAVKNFVHTFRVFRSKRKHMDMDMDSPSDDPELCFYWTPQQGNGFDCGLYVMAISKVICQWYCSEELGKWPTWMKDLVEKVDSSLENSMRLQVLELIQEASVGRLGSVSCTIEERLVCVSSDSDILESSEGSDCDLDPEDDGSGMEDDDVSPEFIGPLTKEEAARAENSCATMSRGPPAGMREEVVRYPRFCGRPRGLLLLEGKKDGDSHPLVSCRDKKPRLPNTKDYGKLKGKQDSNSEPFVVNHSGKTPTMDSETLESSASDCGTQASSTLVEEDRDVNHGGTLEPSVSGDSTQTASTIVEEDLGVNNFGTLEASASCSTVEEFKAAIDFETKSGRQLTVEGVNDLEPVEQGYYDTNQEGKNHTCGTMSLEQKASSDFETSEGLLGLGDQEAPNDHPSLKPMEVKPLDSCCSPTRSASFSIFEGEKAVNDFQTPLATLGVNEVNSGG